MKFLLPLLLTFSTILPAQNIQVYGKIKDLESGKPLNGVIIFTENRNTTSGTDGSYKITAQKNSSLTFKLTGYKTFIHVLNTTNDTILANIQMKRLVYELDPVNVSALKKADTVFGTWKFSVEDYEFYEEKLLLLTFEKNLKHAKIMLTGNDQKILSSFELPDEAKRLYKDYMGYVNVMCENHIYRITVDKNNTIHLGTLPVEEYKRRIMPCIDTIGKNIYFSNYERDYPEFTYYAFNTSDTTYKPLRKVYDKEALESYNMEYYFLNTKDKLTARKIAQEYHIDFHRVAAIMSGVTTSMFYTPLYAPLFVLNDTVYIFDHYSNAIFKYNSQNQAVDSIPVEYHHPKNWKEWKHQLIADELTNEVYAIYQKNGFYYLKKIDLNTGKVTFSYKLINQYVDNMKIKGGYVYYVYRPFESLQERFVYKELISNL